jgi:hypothetical protein
VADQNEISVKLKLDLADLKQQAKQASKSIQQEMNKVTKDLSGVATREPVVTDNSGSTSKGIPSPGAILNPGQKTRMSNPWLAHGTMHGMVAPKIPSISLGGLAGGAPGTSRGMNILGIAAQLGAALVGLRVVVGLAGFAFRQLMIPVRQLEQLARRLSSVLLQAYTQSKPIGYAMRGSVIGQALGVGEREAQVFSMTIKGLNERFSTSIDTMTKLAKSMTALHIEGKAAHAAFDALAGKMLSGMGTALKQVYEGFRVLWSVMQNSYIYDVAASVIGTLSKMISGWVAFQTMVVSGFLTIVNVVADVITKLISMDWAADSPWLSDATQKMFADMKKPPDVNIPVSAGANRMQASAWEKMGLVLGLGSNNPTKEIAANTRKMVTILDRISGGEIPRSGRGVFSPVQAQP